MATHPGMLIAYDEDGNILATQDYRTIVDENDEPLGLADFAGHEEADGEMTDFWVVTQREGPDRANRTETPAKGSKVWPEWIGTRAHEFRVELVGPPGRKRIGALVHRQTGHRRERAAVEAEISRAISEAGDEPADIRHLVGGPDRPLRLDPEGRTIGRVKKPKQSHLPLVKRNDDRSTANA